MNSSTTQVPGKPAGDLKAQEKQEQDRNGSQDCHRQARPPQQTRRDVGGGFKIDAGVLPAVYPQVLEISRDVAAQATPQTGPVAGHRWLGQGPVGLFPDARVEAPAEEFLEGVAGGDAVGFVRVEEGGLDVIEVKPQ